MRILNTDTVSETGIVLATGASRLDTVTVSGVLAPEPASIGLALLGLGGLFLCAHRRTIR